jgi:DNA replication protein DnaC
MQTFNNKAERDAYKEHLLSMATARFTALGLGPVTNEMLDLKMPPVIWDDPEQSFVDGRKLILSGPAGSGKTTLLKKIVWGLSLRRHKPRGGYLPDMLDKFKSGNIGEYTSWLSGGDVLVLDDLDKLRGTHYEGERILAAINHYDTNKLPILVTMNVDIKQFGERIMAGGVPADYVEAIISRLRSRSINHVVSGPDHRVTA